MSALEHDVSELQQLVDGQEPWSHRRRLHLLEQERAASKLASQALAAYRRERDHRLVRLREWGGFALAAAAIVVAVWR